GRGGVSEQEPPGRLCGNGRPILTACPPIAWCDRKKESRSEVRPVHGRDARVRRARAVPKPESRSSRNGRAQLFQIWDHPSGEYLLESNPNPIGFFLPCKWCVGILPARWNRHGS